MYARESRVRVQNTIGRKKTQNKGAKNDFTTFEDSTTHEAVHAVVQALAFFQAKVGTHVVITCGECGFFASLTTHTCGWYPRRMLCDCNRVY